MSLLSGKKKNTVSPTTDENHLAIPNGVDKEGKHKSSPKKPKLEKCNSKLWTDEIQALKTCEEFNVKQTNILSENTYIQNYYDVRNGKGSLVFKAIASVEPAIRDLYHDKGKPPYVITIFDMKAGKEMLRVNVNVRQGVMLVYVKQTVEDKVIGIVRRVPPSLPFQSSTFTLERPNGAVLLKLKSSFSSSSFFSCTCLACRPFRRFMKHQGKSFRIVMSDEVTHVGDINYLQKRFEEKDDVESNKRDAMVTASFPGDTTATNKALVMASLFMLDNLYFEDMRRTLKRPTISRTCYIIIVIVSFVIIIGVLAVVFGGGGYQANKTSGGGRRPGLG